MAELTMSRLPLLAPLRPYLSFAEPDKRYYQRLLAALRPLVKMGLLSHAESRATIKAGEVLLRESERLIAQAHLLLLLLSISYFACQHCTDNELVWARQRAAQCPLAQLLPINLGPVSEKVLGLYGISRQALIPGNDKTVADHHPQDRFWRILIDRLFLVISTPRRDLDAKLCETVYQAIIRAKRETETLDSSELARLQSLDKVSWEIFMEVFLPVIRRAWADVNNFTLENPSAQPMAEDEGSFCCSVYEHLFLQPKMLIRQYSAEQFRSLKHFIYHISVKLLSEQNPK